jgi:hypothetical protein
MKAIALALITLLTISSQAAVWPTVHQWSPEMEQRYTEWVRQNWNINIFANPTQRNGQKNPYYGLRVDCADTVYSMRIIFSYENGLPFVVNDPSSSGKTLSSEMSRWDSQDQTSRIRNFLNYMYDNLSTHTLPNDTYPVAITPEAVHAGGLMMTVALNHHSWSLQDVTAIGVPHLIFNSVIGSGTSVVLQERTSWPNPDWVFEGNQTPAGNAGFRYWKPIQYLTTPNWQVPGYSEEQYIVRLVKWNDFGQNRLAVRKETDPAMMSRLMGVACDGAQSRVNVVRDAVAYVAKTGGACMTYDTYDNYSTPARDQRVFDDIMALRRSYRNILKANGGNQLSQAVKDQLNKLYPFIMDAAVNETRKMAAQGVTAASVCPMDYVAGKRIDLAEFKRRIFAGLMSSNPLDDMQYRWGEVRGPSSRAKACQSWDPWTPNLGQD